MADEPNLTLITKTKGSGRPKQPIEKRRILSDNPHHNRISEKDIPMGETLGLDQVPSEPPVEMTVYERECWDRIVGTQRAMEAGAWIFRSDCSYLITTCGLYGRWREARDQLNSMKREGIWMLDEEGKANPLINIEANLATKYLASLAALGMVPTRRQLTVSKKEDTSIEEEMLA